MGTWVGWTVGGEALAVVAAVAEVDGADGGGRAIPGSSELDDDDDDDEDEEDGKVDF
jgi:hypothetical protein